MVNFRDQYVTMKKWISGCLIIMLLTAFSDSRNDVYPYVKNESFTKGEVLDFKMTYSIFTVGRGSAQIQPKLYKINNRECYKVDIYAKTVGMVDWVTNVNNQYGSYVDTASIVPHLFYRKQREGSYKKDEQTYFDHESKKIKVITADKNTGKWGEPKYYDAPPQVRDLVAGFLYLRTLDLSKVKIKDTVTVAGFFEDQFYKLKIIYAGKDIVKTKAGKIRCIAFKPVMPKNQLFEGENSITAYFSDDKNRIIVKIDAEMFIGSAGVELTGYSGLKNPLNLVKH
jgi:hypothetical protein